MKASPPARKTELRPGIGLCDQCGEPRWPQRYVGYGMMICDDCVDTEKRPRKAEGRRKAKRDTSWDLNGWPI